MGPNRLVSRAWLEAWCRRVMVGQADPAAAMADRLDPIMARLIDAIHQARLERDEARAALDAAGLAPHGPTGDAAGP